MRFVVILCPLFLLCHCVRLPPATIPPPPNEPRIAPLRPTAAPAAAPSATREPVHATNGTYSGITIEGVAFDSRSERLVVVDQADGPGSRVANASAAARAMGGLAAVNAGFFTPTGDPLGLVVAGGKRSGAWNAASSLGSGIWHEDASGSSAISRRENLGRSAAFTMRELIQAGPMLIANGRAVAGLDSTKHRVRTFLLWDGGTRWWLGLASACSLAELSATLSQHQPAGWPVHHGLNLDGGRSSDLWISGTVKGGPVLRRAPWNRPVRNFLVLKPR